MSRSRDTADQINRVDSSAANATAITIDSSEHVLVGKTTGSYSINVVGAEITPLGEGQFTVSSNPVLQLNRKTSDGDIAVFRKDGTTVGSVGVANGDNLYISSDDTNDVGVKFNGDGNRITPCDASGADRNGAIDLGEGSARFKDLYLSGGVYLGGTGAANLLDSYEEGIFTPTYGGGTTNPSGVTYDPSVGNKGIYVKIGKAVFIQINIRTDAITNVGAGDLRIDGLPFAAATLSGQGGFGSFAVSQSKDFAGEVPSAAYITEGNTNITLFYRATADGNAVSSSASDLGTGTNDNLIRLAGTYYSTA